jgi:hypothetical protein
MLLEELLSLPVGARVFGEIQLPSTVPGVVASFGDGSHFIRWDDGYSSIPLGKVRDYDEYIAAHTELRPTRCLSAEPTAEQHHERAAVSAHDYTAGVRRA